MHLGEVPAAALRETIKGYVNYTELFTTLTSPERIDVSALDKDESVIGSFFVVDADATGLFRELISGPAL